MFISIITSDFLESRRYTPTQMGQYMMFLAKFLFRNAFMSQTQDTLFFAELFLSQYIVFCSIFRVETYSAALKLYTGRMRSMISAVGPILATMSSIRL